MKTKFEPAQAGSRWFALLAMSIFSIGVYAQTPKKLNLSESLNYDVCDPILEVELFQPVVLGEPPIMIPDSEENTLGAVTFVNLDNDDGGPAIDKKFDIEDDEVSGGDNELIRVQFKLSPVDITDKHVQLQTLQGAEYVKIWLSDDKTGGTYTPGSPFELQEVNNELVGELWIEGVLPHTTPQGTKFRVQHAVLPSLTNDFSVTIVGVESLSWEAIDNGAHSPYTILDLDPNFDNSGVLKSFRVCPGGQIEGGGLSPPKDKVKLILELSVPVPLPAGQTLSLFLRPFDLDDPSSGNSLIDPNDNENTPGLYYYDGTGTPGMPNPYSPVLTWDLENDNRGMVDGQKFGRLSYDGNPGDPDTGILEVPFSIGEQSKEMEFMVTMYPGDNFRVAANGDRGFVENWRNLDRKDDLAITDQTTSNNNPDEILHPEHYTSPILTVWRRLHLEFDSMDDYTWEENQFNGFFTDYNVNTINSSGTKLKEVNKVQIFDGSSYVDSKLRDESGLYPWMAPSNDLDSSPAGKGRFENGDLLVGESLGLVVSDITGNGERRAKWTGAESIAGMGIKIVDSGNTELLSGVTLDDVIRNSTGTEFEWHLTMPANENIDDYQGEKMMVAGGKPIDFTIEDNTNTSHPILKTSEFSIPVIVRDDDEAPGVLFPYDMTLDPDQLLQDILSGTKHYNDAYVLCLDDGGGTGNVNFLVPFEPDLLVGNDYTALFPSYADGLSFESDHYWVAYVSTALQTGQWTEDGDPDPEHYGMLLGGTNRTVGGSSGESSNVEVRPGGHFSTVAFENARENKVGGNDPVERRGDVIIHEIGHQFGLGHIDDSVMDSNIKEYKSTFSNQHLNLIRCRTHSPGKAN